TADRAAVDRRGLVRLRLQHRQGDAIEIDRAKVRDLRPIPRGQLAVRARALLPPDVTHAGLLAAFEIEDVGALQSRGSVTEDRRRGYRCRRWGRGCSWGGCWRWRGGRR